MEQTERNKDEAIRLAAEILAGLFDLSGFTKDELYDCDAAWGPVPQQGYEWTDGVCIEARMFDNVRGWRPAWADGDGPLCWIVSVTYADEDCLYKWTLAEYPDSAPQGSFEFLTKR